MKRKREKEKRRRRQEKRKEKETCKMKDKTREERRKEERRREKRRKEKRRGDENHPVCTFKTPPCVRSGRLRVYRQQARMSKTFGPVAGTHGDVLTVHTEAF